MTTEAKNLRILIVDDHPMVRAGLGDFIISQDGLEMAGEAENGVDAVEFCTTHDVDVVLMDLTMPIMDGAEATRRILALGKPVKVIALTSTYEPGQVEDAMKAGATSYLLKKVTAKELAEAIRAASGGFSIFAPEAAQALMQANRQKPEIGFDLTDKEREILALLVRGNSNQDISNQMYITMATVKFHMTNIFTKLGAKNRVEAATIALENNLVEKI